MDEQRPADLGKPQPHNMMRTKTLVIAGLLLAMTLRGVVAARAEEPATPHENPGHVAGRFIDAHVHFHDCRAGDLEKVVAWMKSNNVQRVINHQLSQSRPRNEAERKQMVANYANHRGRIDRFCSIYPEEVNSVEEAVKLLTREKQDGAIGFGEHYGTKLNFDAPPNMRLYAACSQVGLPVMFHMDRGSNLDEKGLPRLENVLKTYPKCILIAHSDWWRNLGDGTCDRLLQKYPNLYADISCVVGRSVIGRDKKFAREFFIRNANKLLFGTDSGWWSLGKDKKPAPEFALIDELKLPKEAEEKICRTNAEQLFWSGKSKPPATKWNFTNAMTKTKCLQTQRLAPKTTGPTISPSWNGRASSRPTTAWSDSSAPDYRP